MKMVAALFCLGVMFQLSAILVAVRNQFLKDQDEIVAARAAQFEALERASHLRPVPGSLPN